MRRTYTIFLICKTIHNFWSVLFLNYGWIMFHDQLDSYYFTRPYYKVSFLFVGIIHHSDYHCGNNSANYTRQKTLHYLS